MRFTQSEKHEIIQLVEGSGTGVNKTLKELKIHKRTFYNWYARFRAGGFDALGPQGQKGSQRRVWNKIPDEEKNHVVETALEKPQMSSREIACYITDNNKRFISESSVYRILKERGLITAPAFILTSASDSFKDKTTRVHEMWQTDFTYFKIIGWGWYYLSTVLDDHSRFIVAWDLCESMSAPDVKKTVSKAMAIAGLTKKNAPRLLSDNGSCYISSELKTFLKDKGIDPIHGRPCHPQTQGKIERYHRTMKNVVKLDNYYSPEELIRALEKFVYYYNYERYHESINNLRPCDVYFGMADKILKQREKTKSETIKSRRKKYLEEKLLIA